MSTLETLKSELNGIDIRFDEPLKQYTYTKSRWSCRLSGFSCEIVMNWHEW